MSEQNKQVYSTAQVMKMFDLGRNTLRLYEGTGLLGPMNRTSAGYREFEDRHVEDLRFILEAKKAGFTLSEIKDLLAVARAKNDLTCGTISKEIFAKISEIDMQLKFLNTKKLFLADFHKNCESQNKDSKCDVIGVGFSKSACCN
jgi:DNA-binding transcriptional MerR regulator